MWRRHLISWVRDKMAAIFQTTFSNAFSWIKMYKFRLCLAQLEQLERWRSEDTPAASWLPTLLRHIGSQVKKIIDLELKTILKVKVEWPWRYRSRSKVMVRDTPSHGSDHLCLIWKESIHNCRWYRADTACGTDGRTDGQTDGRSETSIPPQQLRCAGGIISNIPASSIASDNLLGAGQVTSHYLKRWFSLPTHICVTPP